VVHMRFGHNVLAVTCPRRFERAPRRRRRHRQTVSSSESLGSGLSARETLRQGAVMIDKAILDGFEQIDDAKNLSQLVRSNAPQYWRHMAERADLSCLRHYLAFEGIVAGDPHMGNFGILPLRTDHGARQMKYVNIDFDDAGRGPFVLDFIHYVIASKAIGGDVKIRHLQDAYLQGLAGREIKPPKKLKALLKMPVSDYDDMAERYAERRSSKDGFRFKTGGIEPYEGRVARATIEALFASETVIDLATRPVDRGGSAGELRIWILVERRNLRRRIIELKQYAAPATALYQPQPPVEQWLKEVRGAFWPGLEGSEYDLVKLAGDSWFWVREKRVCLIGVPYRSKKNDRIEWRDELARYDANQLGLAHGRQAQASAYCRTIKTDTEAFCAATKEAAMAYLNIAREVEARKAA